MNGILRALSHPLSRLAVLVILAAFSLMALIRMTGLFRRQQEENDRLSRSLLQTVQELREIRTRSGQLAAENEVMELRLKELNALYPKLVGEIRNLRVSPRRTESVATTGYNTETRITTVLRDSVIYDTVRVRKFNWKDPWLTVTGMSRDSLQEMTIGYRDTLVQVVFRGERERPWLWFFSPRKLQQRVTLKNPNARIDYSGVIRVERGRKK